MPNFADVAKQAAAAPPGVTTPAKTWNGAPSHSTSGSARVDLFYNALRGTEESRLVQLLEASYNENALHTLKLVAYLRDCRGGKGERLAGRQALTWLATHHTDALTHNLKHYIDDFGRFDDGVALMRTPAETAMLELLRTQLDKDLAALSTPNASVSLCAKWVPSEAKSLDMKHGMNHKLCRHMKLKPAQLRKKYLAPLRAKLKILERDMCAKNWDAISPDRVPSVAMYIHGKPDHAFERHLKDKFEQ